MNRPGILTPPRPLPGLEGYPATRVLPLWTVAVPLAFAVFASVWWYRRRVATGQVAVGAVAPSTEDEANPTQELVARVRAALVSRFGPGWSARTTEEIAASTELAAIIGDDARSMLATWLADLDQFRFAPNRDSAKEPVTPAGPWLQEIFDRLKRDAGNAR